MADKVNSYSYANTVRDMSEVFETIVKSRPVLSTLLQVRGQATNTKYEWLEDVVTPKSWTLSEAYTADDWEITIANASGLIVGSIVTFEKPTGASSTLNAKVTAVTGSVATITVYGDGSTDENLPTASIVKLVSVPKNEGTDATANDGREPAKEYNYTQIFDRTAKVSKTSQSVQMYGIDSAIDFQVETQLLDLAYEIVNTAIYGQRVERSSSEAGTMGGILYFLTRATGNKVNASGNALSQAILNEGLAKSNENGALAINVGIWHPNQTRKISALNQNQIMIGQEERTRGIYVTSYVWDLWDVISLVYDRNFPKDKFALVDSSKVALVPMRAFEDTDATAQGADYIARRVLWEYTLELRNAQVHTLIHNLAL